MKYLFKYKNNLSGKVDHEVIRSKSFWELSNKTINKDKKDCSIVECYKIVSDGFNEYAKYLQTLGV